MKNFLFTLIFILISTSLVKADDIKDFEIEGMSVGDSLLDYISSKKIDSAFKNASYYKNDTYVVIFIPKISKQYDKIQVTLKPNDKKNIIFSVEGIIDYDNQIENCKIKKKEIIKELKDLFKDIDQLDDDRKYSADPTNNSFSYTTWFFLDTGGFISVSCTKMGNEVRKKNGWIDELSIAVTSAELEKFLKNNPY